MNYQPCCRHRSPFVLSGKIKIPEYVGTGAPHFDPIRMRNKHDLFAIHENGLLILVDCGSPRERGRFLYSAGQQHLQQACHPVA
mmetsp:Transcript_13250/g.27474  ORF Transcript_13250/g.27474 Transcript_13250/m.27474 type:complete len:84 (+) Transcript_13250:44-295(+)